MKNPKRALDVVIVIFALLFLTVGIEGCVKSQSRDNPCDPAVATVTP